MLLLLLLLKTAAPEVPGARAVGGVPKVDSSVEAGAVVPSIAEKK